MTPRHTRILKASGDYYTLTRAQLQDVCGETNDRVMRKLLQQLVGGGFQAKTRMQVVSSMGAAAPVYYLTRKGAEFLAAEVDPKYLHCCTLCPNWQHLLHWIAVSQFQRFVLSSRCAGGYLRRGLRAIRQSNGGADRRTTARIEDFVGVDIGDG